MTHQYERGDKAIIKSTGDEVVIRYKRNNLWSAHLPDGGRMYFRDDELEPVDSPQFKEGQRVKHETLDEGVIPTTGMAPVDIDGRPYGHIIDEVRGTAYVAFDGVKKWERIALDKLELVEPEPEPKTLVEVLADAHDKWLDDEESVLAIEMCERLAEAAEEFYKDRLLPPGMYWSDGELRDATDHSGEFLGTMPLVDVEASSMEREQREAPANFDKDLADDLAASLGGYGVHVIKSDGEVGGMGSMGWVASAALNALWKRDRLVSVLELPDPGFERVPYFGIPSWMKYAGRHMNKGDLKFYLYKDTSEYDYDAGAPVEPLEEQEEAEQPPKFKAGDKVRWVRPGISPDGGTRGTVVRRSEWPDCPAWEIRPDNGVLVTWAEEFMELAEPPIEEPKPFLAPQSQWIDGSEFQPWGLKPTQPVETVGVDPAPVETLRERFKVKFYDLVDRESRAHPEEREKWASDCADVAVRIAGEDFDAKRDEITEAVITWQRPEATVECIRSILLDDVRPEPTWEPSGATLD